MFLKCNPKNVVGCVFAGANDERMMLLTNGTEQSVLNEFIEK